MKKKLTVFMSLLLAAAMLLGACGTAAPADTAATGTPAPIESAAPTAAPTKTAIRIGALNGPTGMGLVNLMDASEAGRTINDYTFSLAGAPEETVAKFSSGEIDIAALPTNLAATLYNKTGGNVQLMALNTLGILYFVEKGDSIKTVADLAGKTIYTSGQGATPEYVLDYILAANGLTDKVKVIYKSEHSEVASLLASGEASVALLPEPFVTATKAKVEGLNTVLDVNTLWADAAAKNGAEDSVVSMGCIVVSRAFAEANKAALNTFLDEYKASVEAAAADVAGTAKLTEKYGIIASAAVAEKALPKCSITYMDGEEMKAAIGNFFDVLYKANPKSIGGKMPGDDLYYTK